MRALRIHLKQNSANYRREETIDNKMTYPLPPYSTIIGALHKACGYTEYHEMQISIQGTYGSMGQEVYTDHCYLNNLQNDRGLLVKMCNDTVLSNGYVAVAAAKKSQGNDFRKGIAISVLNQQYLDEYRALKDLKDSIDQYRKERLDPLYSKIKIRKKKLGEIKKNSDITPERLKRVIAREKELTQFEKKVRLAFKQYEEESYDRPIAFFRTVTKGPKYYEVLYDVDLIIHVCSDVNTLACVYENIGNLTSIGRSEDFVQLEECEYTELKPVDNRYVCKQNAYISANINDISSELRDGIPAKGTKYLLNKEYVLNTDKKQRIFKKKLVSYVSNFCVDEPVEGILIDADTRHIVSLV